MKTAILTTLFLGLSASLAFAGPFKSVDTSKGKVLAAENGMTLYTFRKDSSGTSNCYDKCAANWPPYTAGYGAKASGAYSMVTRKDGKKQWAKNGMPLYFWVKDTKMGDATGDGVGGVWDAARP